MTLDRPRSLGALAALAALAGSGLLAAPASACDVSTRSGGVRHSPRDARPPLVIGDSTMIFATPLLGRLGMEADARGCRQFGAGVAMLRARRHDRSLPRVAILALGANGPIARHAITEAVRIMGRRRVLGLVTPRRSPAAVAEMRRAARRHPERILLIDWVRHSRTHEEWLAGDGLHVTFAGAAAFARLVRRAVVPLVAPPVRSLRMPQIVDGRKGCGRVARFGRSLTVYVTRGDARITCARARAIVRRPPLRRIEGWRFYDWSRTGDGPWSDVYVRRDRKVVVAAVTGR